MKPIQVMFDEDLLRRLHLQPGRMRDVCRALAIATGCDD